MRMAPHTQSAAGGGITIKQPFQPHHQWPWAAAAAAAGTNGAVVAVAVTNNITAPTTTTTTTTTTIVSNGNSVSSGNSVVSNGVTAPASAGTTVVPAAGSSVESQAPKSQTTVTAFAAAAAQASSVGGGTTLLRAPGGSIVGGNSAAAVSPSNKLKRQQPNASSVGTSAAAATAPTTTGVQTDGTGKSNSNRSNTTTSATGGGSNSESGNGNPVAANMAAKRARSSTDGGARIVCKSVGTNTTANAGGPPALVAVGAAGKSLLNGVGGSPTQKKLTQMAIVAANSNNILEHPGGKNGTTTGAMLLKTAAGQSTMATAPATPITPPIGTNVTPLPTELATKANKITGYFKSQMKTTNTFNNLKKNIKTVAGRAFTVQQQQQQKKQLLANGVSERKPDGAVGTPTPSSSASPGSNAATIAPTPFSDADVEKYLKRLQQQTQLVKPGGNNGAPAVTSSPSSSTAALEAVAVATLVAASKKVERKTARIAPTVSATRKISHSVQGGLGVGAAAGQSKKPVTIAPRTTASTATNTAIEAKVPNIHSNTGASSTTTVSFNQSIVASCSSGNGIVGGGGGGVHHLQKTDPMNGKALSAQPPVLLTAIRQQQPPPNSAPLALAQYKQLAPNGTSAKAPPTAQSTAGRLTPVGGGASASSVPAAAVFQFHHQQTGHTAIPIPNLVQISNLLPLAAAATQQQQQQHQQIVGKLGAGGGVSLALTAAAAAHTSSTTTTSAAAALAFASALGAAPSAATANLLVNANARTSAHSHHLAGTNMATANHTSTTTTPQLVMNATYIKIHQIQQQQQAAAAAAAQQAAQQQQQQQQQQAAVAAQQQLMAAATSVASAAAAAGGSNHQQSFTMEASAMNMNFSGMFAKPTTTVVPYSCQPGRTTLHQSAPNGAATAAALYPSQIGQFAAQQQQQQHPQQQLIMTPTGGIFVNAAAIPAMISSQLTAAFTQATANIPALHPLQPPAHGVNGGNTASTNAAAAGQLPNITAIIQQNVGGAGGIGGGSSGGSASGQQQPHHHHHHHHHHLPQQQQQQHHHQLLANISPAILSNLQQVAAAALASSAAAAAAGGGGVGNPNGTAGKLVAPTVTTGAQFVPISAAAHLSGGGTLFATTPNGSAAAASVVSTSLGMGTSGGMLTTGGLLPHHHHTVHHGTATQSLSPPPLVATVPTFTTTGKPIMNAIPNGATAPTMLLTTGTHQHQHQQQQQQQLTCKQSTTPQTMLGGEPPGLVPVQLPKPQQQQQPMTVANLPKLVRSTKATTAGLAVLGRSNGTTQTQTTVVSASSPPALNPLTLDCGSSNDSGIVANSSDSEDKSLTIDLCSPGSPDDSSTGGKKDDEEVSSSSSSSSTSGAGSSKGAESRMTPSQSPPLSAADEEDDCDDHQLNTTIPISSTITPAIVTSSVAAISPFPPPLRLLSDVAVAAAEVEAAIINQRRQQLSVALTIPSNTGASSLSAGQQHSPESTVMELIRQKHLQQQQQQQTKPEHSSMELDGEETCSSAKVKEDGQRQLDDAMQLSLDEQRPQESPMSTASSGAGVTDLQEEYTSTTTRSPSDGHEQKDEAILERQPVSSAVSTESSYLLPPSIETDLLGPLAPGANCARSPILSQPKTIRFPAPNGTAPHHNFGRKGFRRSGDGRLYGACYWRDCDSKFDSSSQLLDHLQIAHVNTQKGPYACLWDGCKVHNKECTKFNWLEKHVLSHGCSKPHKCIVEGCGMRFASQPTLLKHVNSHFANADNASSSKRSTDPPVPKVLRKTGKKLRYRRQPWSARRFDFFDAGIMEGLQHRLIRAGGVASGTRGIINFRGKLVARRQVASREPEMLVRWWPAEILPDEWMSESNAKSLSKLEKQISIRDLTFHQKNDLGEFFRQDRLTPKPLPMVNPFSEIHAISLQLQQKEQQSVVGGSSGSNSNLSTISTSNSSNSSSNGAWSSFSMTNPSSSGQATSFIAPYNSRTSPKQQRKPLKLYAKTATTVASSGFKSVSFASSSSSPTSSVTGGTGFSSIFSTSRTNSSSASGTSSCSGNSQDSCGVMLLSSSLSSSSSTASPASVSASSSTSAPTIAPAVASFPTPASNCLSKASS